MIDRLRQLAIFARTIDHGSFRGAARDLALSPSVVSHHVSQLEEQLGVPLIYRSTRKLSLTPEGERLLAATHKMLAAVEGELADLSAEAKEPSGTLRITLPAVLSQSVLMARIAAFSARYPRIALTLDVSDVRRELIADRFDLAIRLGAGARTSATSRRLFDLRRVLVAPRALVDARGPVSHPAQLQDWPWYTLEAVHARTERFTDASGQTATVRLEPIAQTNDVSALYSLSKAGAALAMVPDFLAQDDIAAGRMVHVLPDWSLPAIEAFAVWPANAPKHGIVHLALDALSDRPRPSRRTGAKPRPTGPAL
ncbi:LysR family transcriptional regulator [Pacificoceanicola onchidii]|uniref:LysR family transcriptional regulator n=1 Tax=Pacificoceanicola onchidii TaxID=2562685 RepID=UPI0010A34608|nr:LysR family transcriptional regulator [Pacificoceanicola onchidii]